MFIKLANAIYDPDKLNGVGIKNWVGGELILTDTHLCFSPNSVNRLLNNIANSGDTDLVPDIKVEFADIVSTSWKFGWFTGIVIVKHKHGQFGFRCFAAKAVHRKIQNIIK